MTIPISQIKEYVDNKSYDRGQKYYQQNKISSGYYSKDRVEGLCEGSYDNYYQVEIFYSRKKILGSNCTCPVGTGRCKHVVALMLSWRNNKHIFTESVDLRDLISQTSKSQLLELCLNIAKFNRDIKKYMETYLLNISNSDTTFNTEDYRRKISQNMKSNYLDYHGSQIVLGNLEQYIQMSDDLIQEGNFLNSVNLLQAISFEILDNYEYFHDEEGEVVDVVNNCVESLNNILNQIDDKELRRRILESLFEIYIWDLNYGGIEIGYEIPEILIDLNDKDEINHICNLLDDTISAFKNKENSSEFSKKWKHNNLTSLKLQLQEETIDSTLYLQEARKNNHYYLYSRKLIELGKIEEIEKYIIAMEKSEATFHTSDLISILDSLVENNYPDVAERIASARIKTKNFLLLEWLRKYYNSLDSSQQETGNNLYLVERMIFDQYPNNENYFNLKNLVSKNKIDELNWVELQNQMLSTLLSERSYEDLIFIYLREDNIVKAIECTKLLLKSPYSNYFNHYQLAEVVKVAGSQYLEDCIEINTIIAERLIEQKNRDAYNTACKYLLHKKEDMIQNEQFSEWKAYIKQLRMNKKRFRALIDELDQANVN